LRDRSDGRLPSSRPLDRAGRRSWDDAETLRGRTPIVAVRRKNAQLPRRTIAAAVACHGCTVHGRDAPAGLEQAACVTGTTRTTRDHTLGGTEGRVKTHAGAGRTSVAR